MGILQLLIFITEWQHRKFHKHLQEIKKKSLKIAERHLKAAGQWPVLKQWSIRVV